MSIREAVPLEDQGSTVLLNSRSAIVSIKLYPDAEENSSDQ